MNKIRAKNKIMLIIAGWLLLSAAMFLYFFKLLDSSNQNVLDAMAEQRTELGQLQAESESYRLAKQDLQDLAKQTYQVDNFFSRDISLVSEIQDLESLAEKTGVKMQLSGVSGTAATAAKAKTTTSLAVIPYVLYLKGSLNDVTAFIDGLENTSFITKLDTLSISAAEGGVAVSLNGNFYIKK